jgi:signal transduction histidine kinase
MILAFYVIKKQQHTLTLLEDANHLLTEQAKTLKKVSALEEREKMAKAIHDHVGHTLTTAILTLEGITNQKDLSTINTQVSRAKNQVKKSLDDIRGLVRKTPNNLDLIPLIESFIETMKAQTSLAIHFEHHLVSNDFLPLQKELILSIIKEAFTNTIKYANATEVDLLIQEINQTLIINFTDNGIGCEGVTCGFGLNSMQKAIKNFNGRVSFESSKNEGFTIQVTLPIGGLHD